MILQINEDLRITTDSMNVTVEKRFIAKETAKNPGEEYWVGQAYFSTVPQAARWLINQHVRDYKGSDVDILCAKLDELYLQIERACKVPV